MLVFDYYSDILLVDKIISGSACFAGVLPDGRPTVCRDGRELAAALKAEGIPATVVGKVTAGRERILHNGEEIRYMNRPARDGIYM